jgi:hypothetical protein
VDKQITKYTAVFFTDSFCRSENRIISVTAYIQSATMGYCPQNDIICEF